MEESKESLIYNYVCSRCFKQIDKCECDMKPYHPLYWVDVNIQEPVRILNEKGYHTKFSCEGHCSGDELYLTFSNKHSFKKNGNVPTDFWCSSDGKTLRYKYPKKITEAEFEEDKKKHIGILTEWCKSLPDDKEMKEIKEKYLAYIDKDRMSDMK